MAVIRIFRPEDMGALLVNYRREHDLTQAELAKRLKAMGIRRSPTICGDYFPTAHQRLKPSPTITKHQYEAPFLLCQRLARISPAQSR